MTGRWSVQALDEANRGRGAPARTPDVKGRSAPRASEVEPEPHRFIRCRRCDQEVSSRRYLFSFRANGSIQVFPNPLGHMRKIITLREAHNLANVGDPRLEYTWFDGYAWTVVVCSACRQHLGWRYDAVHGSLPARFYGLLADAVRD